MVGDSNVSILGRVPTRGFDQTLSKGAFANAEMFIFGLAPAPVTLITDQLRGDFDRGLRIETGSGEDKVYADTIISRPRDNNNLELMTGLGDDEVLLSIGESSNVPVQINTHGDYSHRIKFRSGIDIAELTSSRDKVTVYLGGEFDASGQLIGGVALSEDQFRVLSDIDAIDLKLEGVAAPGSKVTAFVDKSKSGRFDFSNKRGERFAFSTLEKPNEFRLDRDVTQSISFGAGPHFCAGAWISKILIAEVAIPMFFEKFPNIELQSEVEYSGWAFRGPKPFFVKV